MANLYDTLRVSQTPPERLFALQDGREPITYADLDASAARYANALTACGVGPGDRVAIQVDKCIEMLFVYLACLRLGAVFLPANPAYTGRELAFMLEDATPALLVRSAAAQPSGGAGPRIETLGPSGSGSLPELAATQPPEFATRACHDAELAAILYTSGTTGRPKGAMLTHGNLASNALALKDLWAFSADDRLLHALPIFHTHGLFVGTNVTLAAGASMVFLPRFDAARVLETLPQCTVMMGVPTFYTRLLDDPRFTRELVSHMRLFTSGSAPLLAETHIAFEARTGHRILERYGMTETNMTTSNPYDGERRAGTVGFPLPDVEIRVVEPETGKLVPEGEVGVLEVRGPNVFKGYWRMPEKTREEFREDGFFITGDVVTIDPDGYVHIVGRAKDLIISGGFNIYPKEVELLLDEQEGVLESAVIGVPHPDFGEGVVGIVVPKNGSTLDEAGLLAAIQGRIARFKQPKRIFVIDELPRNAMGKVQKNILRERFAAVFQAG